MKGRHYTRMLSPLIFLSQYFIISCVTFLLFVSLIYDDRDSKIKRCTILQSKTSSNFSCDIWPFNRVNDLVI